MDVSSNFKRMQKHHKNNSVSHAVYSKCPKGMQVFGIQIIIYYAMVAQKPQISCGMHLYISMVMRRC